MFKRLADRLQGVVLDTSTITITPEYAAHFLEVYVKKADGAKFTGDRIPKSTIQHTYTLQQKQAFEFGCADDSGQGFMFTRSMHGCGTSAGPSLELEAFLWLKLKEFAASPDLIRPSALLRPTRPGSELQM